MKQDITNEFTNENKQNANKNMLNINYLQKISLHGSLQVLCKKY